MNKEQLIGELNTLRARLDEEVYSAYAEKGREYGGERFNAWERAMQKFLEGHFPAYTAKLRSKLHPMVMVGYHNPMKQFMEDEYKPAISFIDSLIMDINNDEIILLESNKIKPNKPNKKPNELLKKAFIVHGHDNARKLETARFLEKIGFEAIILHEQANGGKTIIEKLEKFTDVGFGIVLYTPDDVGEAVTNQASLKSRARQNVVFEHGLLIGKLGRGKVIPLVVDHNIELPGDISGMVYMSDNGWELQLAREIKSLGYDIDFNKLL
ncbi:MULTISPECIES: TIR domain-containing protein [Acinetobacter]|uniref:TIR domain-containing protein n=1 Tax=Acinetobacter TaxID=469 RepID=UPI0015D17CDB|nr:MULTISPECIES: nucleotide-binding protein [Acinetobacter]MDM1273979.1 nucleotide-binding protein [Acinetobacter indicus]QSQ97018.1 nucleotide-binding protein [Acinetobacter indicus]